MNAENSPIRNGVRSLTLVKVLFGRLCRPSDPTDRTLSAGSMETKIPKISKSLLADTVVVEYVWVDGKGGLRSKTRILSRTAAFEESTGLPPVWNYDGSSTYQGTTKHSEVLLFPKKLYTDALRRSALPPAFHADEKSHLLCVCETSDMKNTRALAREVFESDHAGQDPMFGLELEFFVFDKKTQKPVGWPAGYALPAPQGPYYCSVGCDVNPLRAYMEEVLVGSLASGIHITGYNFEVAPGQAEFQVCSIGVEAADELLLLRYLMMRVGEKYDYVINFQVKPFEEWNGSGLHTNFSTKAMRTPCKAGEGYKEIEAALEKLAVTHCKDLMIYGKGNSIRLTGEHETSNSKSFTFGVGSRAASVRIPGQTKELGYGYFEDRRPGVSADVYLVTSNLFKVTSLDGVSLFDSHRDRLPEYALAGSLEFDRMHVGSE